MTGIRSWYWATTSFGSPVSMVNVSTGSSPLCQHSQRPAKANRRSSANLISYQALSRGSQNDVAGIRHRRLLNADRKDGLVATVSARALVIRRPTFGSSAHDGTKPQ